MIIINDPEGHLYTASSPVSISICSRIVVESDASSILLIAFNCPSILTYVES